MIYVDSSVVLARVFSEQRYPADAFWDQELISSRLLQYEVFNRVHALGSSPSQLAHAANLIGRVTLVDLAEDKLARALSPFSPRVRTLDALHLAAMDYLRSRAQDVELASYDQRMIDAASAMGFAVIDL